MGCIATFRENSLSFVKDSLNKLPNLNEISNYIFKFAKLNLSYQ